MKKKVSLVLIIVGFLVFSYSSSDDVIRTLIGAALVLAGVYVVHERSNSIIATCLMGLAVILGLGGGLYDIVNWGGYDMEMANWWHIIIGFVVGFRCLGRYSSKEVPMADNDTALYKQYCRRMDLPEGRLPLCFMARYDDTYIGIGSDDTIYSYYNNDGVRGVKNIAISNIADYEKYTIDGNARIYIKVYLHGESTYSYGFTMGEHQTFIECLDYLMHTPINYDSPNDIDERFNTACQISGIDPEIFTFQNLGL